MKKNRRKELEKLLDELRYYIPYGIYRNPVEVKGKLARTEVS